MKTKQCTKCNETKVITEFRQRFYKSGKLYRLNLCKDCERKDSRDRSRKKFGYNPKGTPKQEHKIINNEPHIKCRKCNEFKNLNCFTVDRRSKSFERTSICKKCRKQLRRKKYESIQSNEDMIHRIYLNSKHRATLHNILFTIKEQDIILPEKCPYLNIRLEYKGDRKSSPSLDRIDNTKGYIPGNIMVISTLANMVKRELSLEELILFSENSLKIHLK